MIGVKHLLSALRRGRSTRYETDNKSGHWITIGGAKGVEGEHEGGSHVFISGDKITKGASGLVGKSPRDLAKSMKPNEYKSSNVKTQLAPWSGKSPGQMANELRSNRGTEKQANSGKTQLAPAEPAKPEAPKPEAKAETPQEKPPEAKKPMASPDELAKSLKAPAPEASTEPVSSEEARKLFNDYMRLAESEASRIVKQNPSASFDDLKQEALLKLWEVSQKVKRGDEARFPGFAQTAIRNHLASLGRGTQAKKRGAGKVKQMGEEFDAPASGTQAKADTQQDVKGALEQLKSPIHKAIVEGIMEGKTNRELASELGMSASSVNKEFMKAKDLLKATLGSEHYQRIITYLDEKTRYEYGPRHQPPKRLEGAVARLEALAAYAGEIDDEALEDEVEGIAREFSAEDLKEIARKFGIKKGISTKAKTLESLLEKVMKGIE